MRLLKHLAVITWIALAPQVVVFSAEKLPPDYHANLGQGADGRLCRFLRVDYDKLRERTLAGGTDEEVLEWCFENGRRLSEEDRLIYSKFSAKLGWRDEDTGATQRLAEFKAAAGLTHRDDIQTIFDFYEVDEGRRKQPPSRAQITSSSGLKSAA